MSDEKQVLSKSKEYELRGGVTIKVYPASLETLSLLEPKLKLIESITEETSLKDQIKLFIDTVYDLIKDDNDIKKESLKKILTVEACATIIKQSVGSVGI